MFEVFGWAVLRLAPHDSEDEIVRERELVKQLRRQAEQVAVPGLVRVHIDERLNGDTHVLSVAGARNHRYEPVLDLFRELARAAPGSYGLLYVHDGEAGTPEKENAFVVYRLARGVLEERPDPFLSPLIPTIEDPYDGTI